MRKAPISQCALQQGCCQHHVSGNNALDLHDAGCPTPMERCQWLPGTLQHGHCWPGASAATFVCCSWESLHPELGISTVPSREHHLLPRMSRESGGADHHSATSSFCSSLPIHKAGMFCWDLGTCHMPMCGVVRAEPQRCAEVREPGCDDMTQECHGCHHNNSVGPDQLPALPP